MRDKSDYFRDVTVTVDVAGSICCFFVSMATRYAIRNEAEEKKNLSFHLHHLLHLLSRSVELTRREEDRDCRLKFNRAAIETSPCLPAFRYYRQ